MLPRPRIIVRHIQAVTFFLMIAAVHAPGQGSAGSEAELELRSLVDLPTAGMLPHGALAIDMDFYREGGVLMGVSIGGYDRFFLGLSYGGTGIIGTGNPSWNDIPGFTARIRIVDETLFFPAIAIGFDTQGKGMYVDSLDRYTIKSPGFYAVASKNYAAMGFLSIHGGVNYSLEGADGDRDPNFFVGVEKSVGPIGAAILEYNFAVNDSHREALGRGRGYLNAGLRLSFGEGFTLGFNLKDIFKNQQRISVGDRTLQLEYVKPL